MPYLLLVDDDVSVLGILNGILSFVGHTVVATHDGKQALELIEKEPFELVITDLVMPDINGWEIARQVKNKAPDTPVILLTGWAANYVEEDLSRRGIDLLLSKPIALGKLTKSVDRLLSAQFETSLQV